VPAVKIQLKGQFAEAPARTSRGIVHVLVAGTAVIRDGRGVEGALPGKPCRADLSARP
jgi:hypothetical protein